MLMCLSYNEDGEGFSDLQPLLLVCGIGFDAETEEWWTMDNPGRRFRVGRDVRIPEHPENLQYLGPAFVYDDSVPEHAVIANGLVKDSLLGSMPTP